MDQLPGPTIPPPRPNESPAASTMITAAVDVLPRSSGESPGPNTTLPLPAASSAGAIWCTTSPSGHTVTHLIASLGPAPCTCGRGQRVAKKYRGVYYEE